MELKNTAILGNENNYTIFSFGDTVIRFETSPYLEKYTKILQWDNGYIVVMAKYSTLIDEIEEYIDLIPILENLNFDANEFLSKIKNVRLQDE